MVAQVFCISTNCTSSTYFFLNLPLYTSSTVLKPRKRTIKIPISFIKQGTMTSLPNPNGNPEMSCYLCQTYNLISYQCKACQFRWFHITFSKPSCDEWVCDVFSSGEAALLRVATRSKTYNKSMSFSISWIIASMLMRV